MDEEQAWMGAALLFACPHIQRIGAYFVTTDSNSSVAPDEAAHHARVSSVLHTDSHLCRGLPEYVGCEQHDPLPDLCNQPSCTAGTGDIAAPAVVAVAVCVSGAGD